jgi:arginase
MNMRIHVAAYDSGHYRRRMGCGPNHLLDAGLSALLTRLGHTVEQQDVTISDAHPAEIKAAFGVCRELSEQVRKSKLDGWFPVVLSGNCNAAVGTVSGCGAENTGVVWFDAHGEATTPDSTTSGFLDGMGISIMTGQCWLTMARSIPGFTPLAGENILLVGARDLVQQISARQELAPHLRALNQRVDGVYVHFDLDVLDPLEATSNQWTPPGGWTLEEVKHAVREIQTHTTIKAVGFASYDPESDRNGRALAAVLSLIELLVGKV